MVKKNKQNEDDDSEKFVSTNEIRFFDCSIFAFYFSDEIIFLIPKTFICIILTNFFWIDKDVATGLMSFHMRKIISS